MVPKADGCPTIAHPEANFSYSVHIGNRPSLIVRSDLAGMQANDRHQAVPVLSLPSKLEAQRPLMDLR